MLNFPAQLKTSTQTPQISAVVTQHSHVASNNLTKIISTQHITYSTLVKTSEHKINIWNEFDLYMYKVSQFAYDQDSSYLDMVFDINKLKQGLEKYNINFISNLHSIFSKLANLDKQHILIYIEINNIIKAIEYLNKEHKKTSGGLVIDEMHIQKLRELINFIQNKFPELNTQNLYNLVYIDEMGEIFSNIDDNNLSEIDIEK